MYSPPYTLETDRSKINKVIQENPFATIIFSDPESLLPQSFHLPLILGDEKLIGHMAKANQAWKKIHQKEILIIIHGPHCYISPEWYGTENNVPTWNYISIHITGYAQIRREVTFLKDALIKLGEAMDPNFDIIKNTEGHLQLLEGIVGIEIDIKVIRAKFKLAQSKPEDERRNLLHRLKAEGSENQIQIAEAIKETL